MEILKRAQFQSLGKKFVSLPDHEILGALTANSPYEISELQRNAWVHQIRVLKELMEDFPEAYIFFEFQIPRMGKRVDVILILGGIVFVLEYKVGKGAYTNQDIIQTVDYALDLKNFHEGSHSRPIIPILVATGAPDHENHIKFHPDGVAEPLLANDKTLKGILNKVLEENPSEPLSGKAWVESIYKPTPTIIEAAKAFYRGHKVEEISRSDSGAINLTRTTAAVSKIIEDAKANNSKAIVFITGVPGSGKTLAGLNIANERMKSDEDEHAVFLSGNGPLVAVLREALALDEMDQQKDLPAKEKVTKKAAKQKAATFIQNIHHFRDDNLGTEKAPIERVVIFDEAQRAWDQRQTARFMKTKRGIADFDKSEPEFLLSVMDRHQNWCVIICLIGGGQEINVGEAGLTEWFAALEKGFKEWTVYCSDQIKGAEFSWGENLEEIIDNLNSERITDLHLDVSLRSFRAENVAGFVNSFLEIDVNEASEYFSQLKQYPVLLTRDLDVAKQWLKAKARGTESIGLVASSNANRLKSLGLNVKDQIDPTHWFLKPSDDVRSSSYLEDVGIEFLVQGLELDWTCVCWGADLRLINEGWSFHNFRGNKWVNVNDAFRRAYVLNSYRVLLTRARQGMIIFIPQGDSTDKTRIPDFYDETYQYLLSLGIPECP